MKKSITTKPGSLFLLLIAALLFTNFSKVKAQCSGNIMLDTYVAPGAADSVFTITTNHNNELILIEYDGFNFGGGGVGPITVDGNNATLEGVAGNGYYTYTGGAECWAYVAPIAGT